MEFIDLKAQYRLYKKEIDAAIQEVLNNSNYILGQQVAQIEGILAKYVGVKHCITVSSGTDSLQISLMALNIGPGDEVITVPYTWISTAEVIKLVGADVVFVDIEPTTYNIDIKQMEAAITPRTRAIMPVSLFGQMPDFKAINAIAKKHGIPVIEDGAQSFGATQWGKKSCGVTTLGSTSFFPGKIFGCYGDGGAIFTDDDALADKCRAIRNHGGLVRHNHLYIGMNGRFDTLQAAVLLAKWPHFQSELEARARIGARYSALLKDCCVVPAVQKGNTHNYAYYTVRIRNRDAVAAHLKSKGIPTSIYYPSSVHQQPAFAYLGHKTGSFPVSEKAGSEVLSFPMHPFLTESDQDTIVSAVKEAVLAQV